MARNARGPRRYSDSSRKFRSTPYPLPAYHQGILEKEGRLKKTSKTLERNDWEDANCSVCMEFPHNAVLLLCSSHDKGCRPYMCGTSYRYSNCLDLYKKAYTKVLSPQSPDHGSSISPWPLNEKSEVTELSCPLCRGQVKGWTVVKPAREYLNAKKRSCMQDNCSFVGTYKELRKHMRAVHPSAKPREVDPALEQKWRRLEREREHEDVISVIRTSTPGAVVWGDYVIEGGSSGFTSDTEGEDVDRDGNYGSIRGFDPSFLYVLSLVQAFENSRSAGFAPRLRRVERGSRALERQESGGHHFCLLPNGANDAASVGASEGDGGGDEEEEEEAASVIRQGRGVQRVERRRQRRRRSRVRLETDVDMT
uniref:Small nuclear ribonucleoprotein-associated protein B n=1 Tax=Anthurium amnicola TaxID=1678845 RepID=A0A1D1XLK8_9ARAE